MVAEMERKFICERQQAGIEAAKAKGVYKGRKPTVPVERGREIKHGEYGIIAPKGREILSRVGHSSPAGRLRPCIMDPKRREVLSCHSGRTFQYGSGLCH